MSNLMQAIAPKSDQLNADDLIGTEKTITITEVRVQDAGADQPVSIFYEGDNGKPYKPCKSMARVMVTAWGSDSAKYAGRSMTLFRDPNVTFGGMKVGGIRISHMSHIDRDLVMALTHSKGKRAMYTVKPLRNAPTKPTEPTKPAPDSPPSVTDGGGIIYQIGERVFANVGEWSIAANKIAEGPNGTAFVAKYAALLDAMEAAGGSDQFAARTVRGLVNA
jgi:hypothetical protein